MHSWLSIRWDRQRQKQTNEIWTLVKWGKHVQWTKSQNDPRASILNLDARYLQSAPHRGTNLTAFRFECGHFVRLCVCVSLCLTVCLSVCLPDFRSLCLSLCLFFCLSACVSVRLSHNLSTCLSHFLSVCLSVKRSVCLPVRVHMLSHIVQPLSQSLTFGNATITCTQTALKVDEL